MSSNEVEVTADNLIILPPGWNGRWDVVEPVRKGVRDILTSPDRSSIPGASNVAPPRTAL